MATNGHIVGYFDVDVLPAADGNLTVFGKGHEVEYLAILRIATYDF